MNAITIKDLSFHYHVSTPIFQNLNLSIEKGQLVAVVGPNGVGKSTLIKLILGLLVPQNGSISIFGQTVSTLKNRSTIGYVPQKATAFNSSFPATVKEIVGSPLKIRPSFLVKDLSSQVTEVLDVVGLAPYQDRLIGKLSGGQQQRAFIARTLISQPEILLLDEPFVGIDQSSQDNICNILKTINRKLGATIIIITHDLRWVEREVDLMICLEAGQIHCHRQEKASQDNCQHLLYHSHF